MQTRDDTTIRRFLDSNPETDLTNQFLAIFAEDRAAAAQFLKTHSKLGDEAIGRLLALGDDAEDENALGILASEDAALQQTTAEIIEAFHQVNERRWYGRADRETRLRAANSPELLCRVAATLDEMEATYDDIQDPKYHDDFGVGYLAGVQSALAWVLGNHWAMLDT